jgi:hypothetical protein
MTTIIGSQIDRKSDSDSSRALLEKNGSKSSRVGGGYQRKQNLLLAKSTSNRPSQFNESKASIKESDRNTSSKHDETIIKKQLSRNLDQLSSKEIFEKSAQAFNHRTLENDSI